MRLLQKLLSSILLLLIACTPEPFLSLGEGQSKEIKISSNAETATISFNANNSWTAISSESWLTISPSSGIAGMSTVSISAASNPNADPRSAKVTITSEGLSQSITVIQAQKDSFELKDTEFEIGSEGGTIKVPISANADYTIEVAADSKDWITVTKTKALSNYIIELTVAKNTNPDSRQGSVKVKMNGAESTITITQSQMDELIVDKKTFEIGSKGGPIYIPIKANIEYKSEILESGKGWIEISNNQTKGLEDCELVLNIKENKDYDGRVGQVKVSGAGKESVITITQSQLDEIIVTTTSYKIGRNGETFSVPIKANIDYEFSIISGDSWLKAEKVTTKGLEESTLLVTISKNETYDGRNGQIKVYGSDKESVITINQSQLDELIVSKTNYEISNKGGEISIPIQTNIDLEIAILSGSEWIKAKEVTTKALEESMIIATISPNESYDGRVGQIIVFGAGKESIITINQAQTDALITTTTEYKIGSKGGTITVPVSANIDYSISVTSGSEWVKAEKLNTKGLEDSNILVTISKNDTYDSRTALIKVVGARKESVITITQSQLDELILTTTSYKIGSNGGTISVPVKANVDYEFSIISGDNWLKAEKVTTKGLEESTLLVTISKNETYDARNGQIKVVGAGKESVISIAQSKLDEMILTTTSYKIGSNGGTISVPIQANVDYEFSIISGDSWLKAEKVTTKGLEESTLLVTISKNETYDARNGQIKVVGAGKESVITIAQGQLDELIVGKTSYEISKDGGTLEISFETNAEYRCEVLGEASTWITIIDAQMKALEAHSIWLSITKNELSSRVGQVRISGAGKQSIITITQKPTVIVNINETPIELSCESSTFEITAFSTIDLEVKSDVDWIKLIDTKVNNRVNYVYTFSIETNPLVSARNTIVYFTNKDFGVDKEIVVSQALNDYLVVHNSAAGSLSETLSGYEFNKIKKLEITGLINNDDLIFVRDNCTDLTHLNIGGTDIESIGAQAFLVCRRLKSITIPDGVTSIGDDAFNGCNSLASIRIPSSVAKIGKSAFQDCLGLKSITIPDGVTLIRDSAFEGCSSLKSITIPSRVTYIGASVFSDCCSLASVYCKPVNPPIGGTKMFNNIAANASIYVPSSSLSAYTSKQYWSDYWLMIKPYKY